jgi:hypothetical protein
MLLGRVLGGGSVMVVFHGLPPTARATSSGAKSMKKLLNIAAALSILMAGTAFAEDESMKIGLALPPVCRVNWGS